MALEDLEDYEADPETVGEEAEVRETEHPLRPTELRLHRGQGHRCARVIAIEVPPAGAIRDSRSASGRTRAATNCAFQRRRPAAARRAVESRAADRARRHERQHAPTSLRDFRCAEGDDRGAGHAAGEHAEADLPEGAREDRPDDAPRSRTEGGPDADLASAARERFGANDAWTRKWLNDYWLEGMFGTAFDDHVVVGELVGVTGAPVHATPLSVNAVGFGFEPHPG